MAKHLVIVESPAKARTLTKYLGRDYQVKASVGHVVDLPKSKLGVDLEKDFAPEYQVIHGKGRIITELRQAAKGKENIYLAPDPDREGEAIAWHIAARLDGQRRNVRRVLFNEITKRAVQEALKHPKELDQNLFEAQQTRRILDRLVGYQISPLLWQKVRRGLSAGRVQSVAVRIVCEREREIQAFQKTEYWSITAQLDGRAPPTFAARLLRIGDHKLDPEKFRIENATAAGALVERLRGVAWRVDKVERKERRRFPTPPFITSRLQQEASRKLGFVPSRTMRIAQRLYEGVELGAEGPVGLITYMRTDSVRTAPEALQEVRRLIGERFGKEYLPEDAVPYRTKKGAQDAHEAIRPTALDRPPDSVASFLSKEELALYTLIWNRFVASQMMPAVFDQTTVDIGAADTLFRASGQIMKFDGFIRVYTEGRDEEPAEEDDDSEHSLPPLAEGDALTLRDLLPEQHFTQPPPRFSQATLIKELEEKGIGRPSTYASIMSTILNKEYVVEDRQRRLRPTELGFLVTDMLVQAFPDILNVEFTAGMETVLDDIEDGRQNWVEAMRRFYAPFARDLEHASEHMRDVKREGQPTDISCPKCGGQMVVKWGRSGEFLACSRYPECKSTANFTRDAEGNVAVAEEETTSEVCEVCGRPMQVRFGRYGKFLGCSGYPECRTVRPMVRPVPTGIQCPDCKEGEIMEKRSRSGKTFFSCNRYPQCRFATWDRPVAEPCPTCGAPFVVEKITKRAGTVRRCLSEGCKYKETVAEPEEDGVSAALTVIGGGLAGCEAAWVAAHAGCEVRLCEMRPVRGTAAHQTEQLAELVCSNSFRNNSIETAVGLLKEEMRRLGSLMMRCADAHAVPAGAALAVDRDGFAAAVTAAVGEHPRISVAREEVTDIPDGVVIVASGPLTSPALSQALQVRLGQQHLYFYDAIAPIITADSIDRSIAFSASRYDKGGDDYLNCPFSRDEYYAFVDAVLAAEKVPTRDFERCVYFEGCMPIEEMARRGRDTLAFGPMRPVGLIDPRSGKRPFAVAQARQDDAAATLYNLVGFQTKMTYPAQRRVLRMIPGLADAEFVRLGSLHRNTFINSPAILRPTLQLRAASTVFLAGQLIGVEGYVESAASGILAGHNAVRLLEGRPLLVPPASTALGSLIAYVTDPSRRDFQPMNANYGLFPPMPSRARGRARRTELGVRAARDADAWMAEHDLALPGNDSREAG